MRSLYPSPVTQPSGRTMAQRPPGLSNWMKRTMKRSADYLSAAEGGREICFHAIGDAGTERRVGQDDLDLLLWADGVVFSIEAVAVVPVGHVEAVKDEIREAQQFTHVLCDIETLNQRAIQEAYYDVTAISFHAYPYIQDNYTLMACGGRWGKATAP